MAVQQPSGHQGLREQEQLKRSLLIHSRCSMACRKEHGEKVLCFYASCLLVIVAERWALLMSLHVSTQERM